MLQRIFEMRKSDDLAGVRQAILEDKTLLNSTHYSNCTLLHEACWDDQTSMVELLLGLGADPNARSAEQHTPLTWGIYSKASVRTVNAFIRHGGANLDAVDKNGVSPLIEADRAKKRDVTIALLRAGARKGIEHILHTAVYEGDEELVDILFDECHADPNTIDWLFDESLLYTVVRGNEQKYLNIARKLLSLGADVNLVGKDGHTPLHAAVNMWSEFRKYQNLGYREQMVELYLKNGAKLNAARRDGETPVFVGAGNSSLAAVKMLIEKATPEDITYINNSGETILHRAALNTQNDVCQFIIDLSNAHGIDINAVNNEGLTPLHYACEHYLFDNNIERLLRAGADRNMQDREGRTPLQILERRSFRDEEYLKSIRLLQGLELPVQQTLLGTPTTINTEEQLGAVQMNSSQDQPYFWQFWKCCKPNVRGAERGSSQYEPNHQSSCIIS